MKTTTRTIVVLVCSLLIFLVGTYRIILESLAGIPLFVAYIFAVSGLIGSIANGFLLRKKLRAHEG